MIATRIEEKLRSKIFGIFWKNVDPFVPDFWQSQIIQCVEDCAVQKGGRWFAPDCYIVIVQSELVKSAERFYAFQLNIEQFIKDYITDSGFSVVRPVSIDVKTANKQKAPLLITGYTSEFPVYRVRYRAAVGRLPDNFGKFELFHLDGPGKYLIGRSKNAAIHLDHQYVSDYHVVLTIEKDGRCFIGDLHSTNGTVVNQKRIEPGKTFLFSVPCTVQIAQAYELFIRNEKLIKTEN